MISSSSPEEIGGRLADGESIAAIRRSLLPPEWARLLRFCAAAHVFSEDVLMKILLPAAGLKPVPVLGILEQRGLVEPAAGRPHRYQLCPEDRDYFMATWFGNPPGEGIPADLAKLSERLAEYYREADDELERLRHEMFARADGQDRVRRLFKDAIDTAVRDRDFSGFQDLLDVLGDRSRVGRAGLAEFYTDQVGHLQVLQFWTGDYERSVRFLEPADMWDRVEGLLVRGDSRAWQIFGPSGVGKTTQLRWLITRYCIPSGIPCSRVDLEVVDPVNLGRYPWLVLLRVAQQLRLHWPRLEFGRIRNPVFETMLSAHGVFASLLRGTVSEHAKGAGRTLSDSSVADRIGREVTFKFVEQLNEVARDVPTLVVVDTVEEMSRHGTGELEKLLDLLADVHARCPSLRLVLAGRENLREANRRNGREGLDEVLDRLGCVDVRTGPFQARESRAYLRDIRGIKNPELVNAVVSMADGVPLTLALYADFIDLNPSIRADELKSGILPPLRHLIDRAPGPGVVFLLRYGIVPRRLRFEDVATVMRRFLTRAVAEPPVRDMSDDVDALPADRLLDDADIRRIWQDLLSYTAASSWVQYEPGDTGTITFHPNAATSMHRLVAADPTFVDLHRAFAEHFTALADDPESGSVTDCCQALYHRFQIGDPLAPVAWREALEGYRRAGKLDDLTELAQEVLGDDYLNGDGDPKTASDGNLIVERAVIAEAWLFAGYAAFRQAWREQAGGADPRWAAVARCLGRYDAFGADLHPLPLPRAGLATTLRTALMLAVTGPLKRLKAASAVVTLLQEALTDASGDDRADVLALLGDCYAVLGGDAADSSYQEALDAISREDSGRVVEIWSARVRHQVESGDFVKALDYCDQAVRDQAVRCGDGPLETPIAVEIHRIEILNRRAEPSQARAVALETGSRYRSRMSSAGLATVMRARAQAEILLGDDERALKSLDEAEEIAQRIPGEEGLRHLAETCQLRGALFGELLRLRAATDEFMRADGLWREELGYPEGNLSWRSAYGWFLLRQVGDAAEARRVLPEPGELAASIIGSPGAVDEGAVRGWLLSVEAHTADGDMAPLRILADSLDSMASRRTQPQVTSLVAVTGLMLALSFWPHDSSVADGFVRRLTSRLGEIRPPTARLAPLSNLVDCHVPLARTPAVGMLLECLREAGPGLVGPFTDRTHTYPLWSRAVRLCGDEVPPRGPSQLADGRIGLLAWWRWLRYSSPLDTTEVGATLSDSALEPLLRNDRSPLLRAWALRLRADLVPHHDRARLLADAITVASEELGESRWLADIQLKLAEVTGDDADLIVAGNRYASLGLPYRSGRQVHRRLLADGPGEVVLTVTYPDADLPRNIDDLQRVIVANRTAEPEISEVLGRELGQALDTADPNGDPFTLGLSSDDPFVQMLPWELADPGFDGGTDHRWRFGLHRRMPLAAFKVDTRWLRAARAKLGDDDDWPVQAVDPVRRATLHGVHKHHSVSGDEPWVAVVRPGFWAVDEAAVSLRLPGSDVAHGYVEQGFRVRDIARMDMSNAGLRLAPPPTVLHLSTPLGMAANTPYLDIAGIEANRRPGRRVGDLRIRPRDVAAWMRGYESGHEPVVVLDPPHPGMSADLPWQLLLRNLFAALLFQQAVVPVVVATGLGDGTSRDVVDNLAEGLRMSRSAMSVIRAIRQNAGREPAGTGDDAFASRATAVFAASSALELE